MTGWQVPDHEPPPYTGPPETAYPPAPPYGPSAPGYPPGYPAFGAYTPGYPAPGPPYAGTYPGFPGGFPDPRDARPGPVLGAAVLAYINAGLLVLSAGLLLLGASIVSDVESETKTPSSYVLEFSLDGIINLLASALLISGGVMLTGRRTTGRTLLTAGNAVIVAEAVYWLVRFSHVSVGGLAFYTALFGGLAIVSGVLSWLTPVRTWLVRRS